MLCCIWQKKYSSFSFLFLLWWGVLFDDHILELIYSVLTCIFDILNCKSSVTKNTLLAMYWLLRLWWLVCFMSSTCTEFDHSSLWMMVFTKGISFQEFLYRNLINGCCFQIDQSFSTKPALLVQKVEHKLWI